MSAGKNPILRYGIIDHCLNSKVKRYWSPEDLIQKFTNYDIFIELRALKYDLQNMRSNSQLGYDAPISYCRRNKGYYYTDEGYSIYGDRLNQKDFISLTFILNLIERFEGADILEQVKETINKLNKTTKKITSFKATQQVISNDPLPFYRGRKYLVTLVDAIISAQPLKIIYQKFNTDSAGEHIFHPYQLKVFNDRWYVRGYSEKHQDVIALGLDRVEDISLEHIPYRHDNALDEKEYFYHTIGITKGKGPVEEVLLSFTPSQAPYIRTCYLHHTQQILRDDSDEMIISMQLIQNYELCQLLLSLVPNIKVLAPQSLREKIIELLKKGLVMNESL